MGIQSNSRTRATNFCVMARLEAKVSPLARLRRHLLSAVLAAPIALFATGLVMAQDPFAEFDDLAGCERDGSSVECFGGLKVFDGEDGIRDGLIFTEGFPDQSGNFEGGPTEILNISDMQRNIFLQNTPAAIGVIQFGNISINVEARDEFLVDLQALAGDDGTFTIAEFTAFAQAAGDDDDGPSPEEFAAFLALLEQKTGVDAEDPNAVISVDDAFTTAAAVGGLFEIAEGVDEDGNVNRGAGVHPW